jgi:fructose-bisphosphate aldolase class I
MLEGLVLKPNMVTKGIDAPGKNIPEQVAYYTIKNLSKNLPACVPGITFLSGGQSEM